MEKKHCGNCAYYRLSLWEPPCKPCNESLRNWKSKEENSHGKKVERVKWLCHRYYSCEECPVNADENTRLFCQMKPFRNMPDDWLDNMREVFNKCLTSEVRK